MKKLLLALTLAALGCAAPEPYRDMDKTAREKKVLLDVPFYADDTDQCGPSSLASVLNFYGKAVGPEQLKQEIYIKRLQGTLAPDLLIAAEARGLQAELITGSLEEAERDIDAGRPLIAFINKGFSTAPVGHYLVLTGYDNKRWGFFAHSGLRRNVFIPYRTFILQWNRTQRWTLRLAPKAQKTTSTVKKD